MSKVFYPKNIGGMSIKWVDEYGDNKNSEHKSDLLVDNIATMSEEVKGDKKRVYLEFFKEYEKTLIGDEDEYKTYLKIDLTEAIKHDFEWMNMQNRSLSSDDSHYINLDSLSITEIEVNDDFNFIRIHYDFCQNHFACSSLRRRMVGAVYRLDKQPTLNVDVQMLFTNLWDGPIVFW